MLISATKAGEVRVALLKGSILSDLDIEVSGVEQKKANIYKARVSRVEPSLDAAFIDYGADRHGFLPFKEVSKSCFKPGAADKPFSSLNIKDVLNEGQELLVQVDKEERGNKGAALTTFISLAGSYLVLMPNNPRVGGISRRIDGKERDEMRDLLKSMDLPEGMGLIVRTAGVGKSQRDLKWDLESLLTRWKAIEDVTPNHTAPSLIHQEGDAVMRAIRDYLRRDIEEILVDTPQLCEKAKDYITQVKPDFAKKIHLYQGDIPLFSFYQVEKQIETAYLRTVKLPSGGSISIDHTEALISIDVNSARATSGGDIEETALTTNLEAAEEIARQLRIRDLGGLIVIDFIDMAQQKNQREVSRHLQEALEYDRARVQVGSITRFGLLEMSRQRLRSHLGAALQVACPRCEGQGTIRSIESLASSIIRILEEETLQQQEIAEFQVQAPIDLATFLLNERRADIFEITSRTKLNISIIPNRFLETPKYKIIKIRADELAKNKIASYNTTILCESKLLENHKKTTSPNGDPLLNNKTTITPAVTNEMLKNNAKNSIVSKVLTWISKLLKKTASQEKKSPAATIETKYPSGSKPRTRSPHNNRRNSRNNYGNKPARKISEQRTKRAPTGELGRKRGQPSPSSKKTSSPIVAEKTQSPGNSNSSITGNTTTDIPLASSNPINHEPIISAANVNQSPGELTEK